MGSAVSAVTGAVGDVVGGALGGISGGIARAGTPEADIANQGRINDQIGALQGQTGRANDYQDYLQRSAQLQGDYAQNQQMNTSDAIDQAQALNQGPNVRNALGLLATQANGSAPSAAEGVLQQGTDQAIATQAALANSGNLSQMIGGQKTAMDNAANLVQQHANQASQLRANQQALGQQQYANASQNQANQATANANAHNALASNAINFTNAQQQAGLGYGQLAGNTANAAGGLAAQGTNTEQGARSQANQNLAVNQAGVTNGIGGMLSAVAPIAAGALFSDERLKKNVESDETEDSKKAAKEIKEGFLSSDEGEKKNTHKDSMIQKFLEKLEPSTFEYKQVDGQMGRTPGTHMGVMAQDVEKAPGGESMVIDTPKGKAIDLASAVGALMSAAADAHERIAAVEELFKHKKGAKK